MLTAADECGRTCLAIVPGRTLRSEDVIETLADLFVGRGVREYIWSDTGPQFCSRAVREWLNDLGVETLFIEPGSPWENGYNESFNGKLRDELLKREIFYTLAEAKGLIDDWRQEYNTIRPHSSLGYRPPEPEALFGALGGVPD
jgi:transposase InsO family protein